MWKRIRYPKLRLFMTFLDDLQSSYHGNTLWSLVLHFFLFSLTLASIVFLSKDINTRIQACGNECKWVVFPLPPMSVQIHHYCRVARDESGREGTKQRSLLKLNIIHKVMISEKYLHRNHHRKEIDDYGYSVQFPGVVLYDVYIERHKTYHASHFWPFTFTSPSTWLSLFTSPNWKLVSLLIQNKIKRRNYFLLLIYKTMTC